MDTWNAEQYLKFEKQRTLPSYDLAASLGDIKPQTALDIGCGPGNSTAVLREFFTDAHITGIDNSPVMIEKARKAHPEMNFELRGARDLEGKYELIFSNACLHWVPDHHSLIPFIMDHLADGGTLAVQVPMNGAEPLYKSAQELIDSGRWDFSSVTETNEILTPEEYYEVLSACSRDFDIWEKVYYHIMPSHQALVDWVKSTKLRPYLAVLNKAEEECFLAELLACAQKQYQRQKDGNIIFRFRRLFFTAKK